MTSVPEDDERCGWLVEFDTEDGPASRDCGAAVHTTHSGWSCERGHSHTYADVRAAEGWDYAHDEQEAALLGRAGIYAVRMDGHPF
ncbi:hypothetical protein [Streptomyces sp.]|uniref:hypothetical protein n=1 Tax=Streptomyces sp. TaxID=1931 RepID=UPI002D76D384|nr:hypothetical protein [Streptomyces sp.]HET6354679.1 hypothetical protein [Streptomyces sp.]